MRWWSPHSYRPHGGSTTTCPVGRRAVPAWARVGRCEAIGASDLVECDGVELEMLALPRSFAAYRGPRPLPGTGERRGRAGLSRLGRGDRQARLGRHVTRFETVNRRRCKDALTAEYIEGCISKHSFGIAADVRAFEDNASWPAVVAQEPGVVEMLQVFEANGFRWGGDFRSNFDPQHVEWKPR